MKGRKLSTRISREGKTEAGNVRWKSNDEKYNIYKQLEPDMLIKARGLWWVEHVKRMVEGRAVKIIESAVEESEKKTERNDKSDEKKIVHWEEKLMPGNYGEITKIYAHMVQKSKNCIVCAHYVDYPLKSREMKRINRK